MDFKELDANNPTILKWKEKLEGRCPHLRLAISDPGLWMGVVDNEEILAIAGMTAYDDGVIAVQYVMCEPSRRGLAAMIVMLPIIKATAKKFIFAMELSNKRMLRIVKALGAVPTAVLLEVNNG